MSKIRNGFSLAWVAALLYVLSGLLHPSPVNAQEPDALTQDYYSVLTTYACHARSLWHDAPSGGYWGDGLNAKNQNGAVRGTASTFFTYAMLVDGLDKGLIARRDRKMLRAAGLSRHRLISFIRKNAEYLVAHHKSAGAGLSPEWGYNWQSSLWMGALGPGALLVWDELGPDLKTGLARVAAAEADWVASRPPKSGTAGDTGAEENAWDTHAPAVALALTPEATSATLWWNTLQVYAANVYSRPADLARAKAGDLPPGPARDVTTANILDDFSLNNHGFFHPDYVQISAQHLGEAWVILAMGDKLHGTHMAPAFAPYARFNVEQVWTRILKPLLMPWGEFAFPAGNDWTFHCSTNQGYFAYIATAFGDADAAEAERRGLRHVMSRREAGPPGRLLGDSNLEWWWEALVAKRCSAALLMHQHIPAPSPNVVEGESADNQTTTVLLDHARVWFHRTPSYFASVSWGNPQQGFFAPLGEGVEAQPYMTLPTKFGIVPRGTTYTLESVTTAPAGVSAAILRDDGKVAAAVVGLPNSVVWLSLNGFGHVSIENDSLTLPGRVVETAGGIKVFQSLTKANKEILPGPWLSVDDFFAMASDGDEYSYTPASQWNMKSVAADKLQLTRGARAWQMATGSSEDAAIMGQALKVKDTASSGVVVSVSDRSAGESGNTYRLKLGPARLEIK